MTRSLQQIMQTPKGASMKMIWAFVVMALLSPILFAQSAKPAIESKYGAWTYLGSETNPINDKKIITFRTYP
jgi:hypothetical protein